MLAPATVEDCFYDIQRAFNLADKYQCPVIVLTDLVLGLSKQTVEIDDIDFERIAIDRGQLLTEEEVKEIAANGGTSGTPSPSRASRPGRCPGQEGGVHMAISYEHDEEGEEDETPCTGSRRPKSGSARCRPLIPRSSACARAATPRPISCSSAGALPSASIDEARRGRMAEGRCRSATCT